jgi:hypothetical protein
MNDVLGMGPQADQEKHTCENCGKEIKPGEHFTMDDKKYCCETCCKVNTPDMKKTANVCEFC